MPDAVLESRGVPAGHGSSDGAVAILECRGVTVGHPGPDGPVAVVRDVDFRVREGEAVVLVGASGSGKSTLLRALNRFDDPLRGTVLHRGRDVRDVDPLELRRRVSLVPQTAVMFDGTVADNLKAVPKGSAPPTGAELEALLSDVGLDASFLERDADGLSGGEKQRIALARALARRPEALLLDEPTSALDPESSAALARLLGELRAAKGVALVVVTHQPDLATALGDRRLRLAGGRLRDEEP